MVGFLPAVRSVCILAELHPGAAVTREASAPAVLPLSAVAVISCHRCDKNAAASSTKVLIRLFNRLLSCQCEGISFSYRLCCAAACMRQILFLWLQQGPAFFGIQQSRWKVALSSSRSQTLNSVFVLGCSNEYLVVRRLQLGPNLSGM